MTAETPGSIKEGVTAGEEGRGDGGLVAALSLGS